MTAAEHMRAAQRHDLLIIEAHAIENVAQVLRALRCVGQTTVWRAVLVGLVDAARSERDLRTLHLLDRDDGRELPQIGIAQRRMTLLDWFKKAARHIETGVGAVLRLGSKAHRLRCTRGRHTSNTAHNKRAQNTLVKRTAPSEPPVLLLTS